MGYEFTVFLVTFAIILWVNWLWSRRHFYRFSWSFPGKIGLPIFGVLLHIRSMNRAFEALHQMMESCSSSTIFLWLGLHPNILTADPVIVQKVLTMPELLNKTKIFYDQFKDLNGESGGLVCLPAEPWQRHRKLLNPAFRNKVLSQFFPAFNKAQAKTIAWFAPMADDGRAHDVYHELMNIVLSLTMETTMGKTLELNERVEEKFVKSLSMAIHGLSNQILLNMLRLNRLYSLHILFQRSVIYARTYMHKLVFKRIKHLEEAATVTPTTTSDKNAFVEYLEHPKIALVDLASEIHKKNEFTFREFLEESFEIILASFETVTVTVYSTILMLAMHPDIQERLFKDIVHVYPTKSVHMELEHVNDIPYLSRIIDEVLRLVPAVPIVARQVVQDTKINEDLILPKGLQILISIFHLHRSKDIWGEDADKFNPDRFLTENKANRHPYAHIPFSKGRRNCIGWRYALFALKTVVTGLVRNYRFETDAKLENVRFRENVVIDYVQHPKLRVYKRL